MQSLRRRHGATARSPACHQSRTLRKRQPVRCRSSSQRRRAHQTRRRRPRRQRTGGKAGGGRHAALPARGLDPSARAPLRGRCPPALCLDPLRRPCAAHCAGSGRSRRAAVLPAQQSAPADATPTAAGWASTRGLGRASAARPDSPARPDLGRGAAARAPDPSHSCLQLPPARAASHPGPSPARSLQLLRTCLARACCRPPGEQRPARRPPPQPPAGCRGGACRWPSRGRTSPRRHPRFGLPRRRLQCNRGAECQTQHRQQQGGRDALCTRYLRAS
jgi:hypothetical protein